MIDNPTYQFNSFLYLFLKFRTNFLLCFEYVPSLHAEVDEESIVKVVRIRDTAALPLTSLSSFSMDRFPSIPLPSLPSLAKFFCPVVPPGLVLPLLSTTPFALASFHALSSLFHLVLKLRHPVLQGCRELPRHLFLQRRIVNQSDI